MGALQLHGEDANFPKFYIKAVGGRFSIEHRLTHTFVETVDSEEELVELITDYNSMDDEELWQFLLFERYAHVPKNMVEYEKTFAHQEDWYLGAWSAYTNHFYEKYPELLVTEVNIPYAVVSRLRQKAIEDKMKRHKRNLELVNNSYKDEPKKLKRVEKEAPKPLKKVRKPIKVIKRRKGLPNLPKVEVDPFA